jgi:hypothetical protein
MARETYAEAQIPATGAEDVPYADHRAIARGLMGHATECFVGQVTGAGGAGGDLAGIPFEPAVVEIINEAGAAPAYTKYVMLGTPIGVQIILGALDATSEAPAVAEVAGPPKTWTLTLDTADAPDAEVATVIVYGVHDTDGGL